LVVTLIKALSLIVAGSFVGIGGALAQAPSATQQPPAATGDVQRGPFNPDVVPEEMRDKLLRILRGYKLIGPSDTLEVLRGQTPRFTPINPSGKAECEAGCDLAAAGASAACLLIGFPPAVAICLAAAEAGRNYCRSKCE